MNWASLRAKAHVIMALGGTAEEAAEKLASGRKLCPQRLKPYSKRWSSAAVNRCATQNRAQHRVFPQAVKPCPCQERPFPETIYKMAFSKPAGCAGREDYFR